MKLRYLGVVFYLDFQRSTTSLKLHDMIYGNETWPMKKGHESMLEKTQMRMSGKCGTVDALDPIS